MNLIDIGKRFGTEEACVDFLEQMRWSDGVVCLKCGSKNVSRFRTKETERTVRNRKTSKVETKRVPARFVYQCADCDHQFSVTTGTIFHDTHLDLDKWFMAVALMVNAKKGVSALQMKRDLQIAYKTAWYLNHRIRKAIGLIEAANDEPLTGTVEVDETYIGGKYDKRRKRQRWDKEPVFGIVAREGKARTYHIPDVNRWHVIGKIQDNISINADLVCTDESHLYKRMPTNIQKHEIVNHSAKEWVRGDVHTGTIDGYWGLLKRGIIGTYHQLSIKHLARYLSEFQFRWNNRDAQDMFALLIVALVIGTVFPYAELVAKTEATPSSASDETEPDDEPF